MGLEPGTKLGNFEIADLLGKGGMGEVYRAKDTKLEREVAISASDDAGCPVLRRRGGASLSLYRPLLGKDERELLLETESSLISHRAHILPGADAFLLDAMSAGSADNAIFIFSMNTRKTKELISGLAPHYLATGHPRQGLYGRGVSRTGYEAGAGGGDQGVAGGD